MSLALPQQLNLTQLSHSNLSQPSILSTSNEWDIDICNDFFGEPEPPTATDCRAAWSNLPVNADPVTYRPIAPSLHELSNLLMIETVGQ